jgi:hypothetical protein
MSWSVPAERSLAMGRSAHCENCFVINRPTSGPSISTWSERIPTLNAHQLRRAAGSCRRHRQRSGRWRALIALSIPIRPSRPARPMIVGAGAPGFHALGVPDGQRTRGSESTGESGFQVYLRPAVALAHGNRRPADPVDPRPCEFMDSHSRPTEAGSRSCGELRERIAYPWTHHGHTTAREREPTLTRAPQSRRSGACGGVRRQGLEPRTR